ncbi:hypothetical protein cypCar_00001487, partial [Cyprinus carpio]
LNHQPGKPTVAQVKWLISQVNWERLWYSHLRPILTEHQPRSRGSLSVQKHIFSQLDSLSVGWSVEVDPSSPKPLVALLASLMSWPCCTQWLLADCFWLVTMTPN